MIAMNCKRRNTVFYALVSLNCLLFALYGMEQGNNLYGLPAIVCTSVMLLLCKPEESFYILVAMIPFGECWKIGGHSIRGLMCLLPLFNILKQGKLLTNKVAAVAGFFALLSFEILNDLRFNDMLSVLNTVAPWIYMCSIIILTHDSEHWNLKKMGYIFVFSTLIAEVAVLQVGGGFGAYNNDISFYRFGQESIRTYLPGSMEIPIFSCLSMSFLSSLVLCDSHMSLSKKIGNLGLCVLNFLFGIMTVSRVFILGIAAMLCLSFIWLIQKNYARKAVKVVCVFALVGLIIFIGFHDYVFVMLNKMFSRLSVTSFTSGSNGRTYIWDACVEYLFTHPKALLVGEGIISYPLIGLTQGLAFSAQAHNFFLDIWMATGVVGLVSLFVLFKSFFKKQKKFSMLAWSYIGILVMMFMVSGNLNYIRNYIYFLMAILFHNNFINQIEKA